MASQSKILVVDDNRNICDLIAARLKERGLEVATAANGLEALEITKRDRPDLVLLDIMLPWLNGFEVAKVLKADAATRQIPIIFLTVKDRIQDKIMGFQIGADDYITKPFNWDELLARIGAVLRRAAAPPREPAPAAPVPEGKPRGIAGGLTDVSLANLIQFIEVDKKSGILTLTHPKGSGYVLFSEGRVANAVAGRFRAEAALFHMLGWQEGGFAFEPWHAPVEQVITAGNQELLVQGLKRKEAVAGLRARLPAPGTRLAPRSGQAEEVGKPETREVWEAFADGRTVEHVVDALEVDELTILETAAALYERGLLAAQGGP
ncbi:MAG: response regulator [candidate division NC10 bacterium]|nr:response regulator [candidate division NC10 bacterium]